MVAGEGQQVLEDLRTQSALSCDHFRVAMVFPKCYAENAPGNRTAWDKNHVKPMSTGSRVMPLSVAIAVGRSGPRLYLRREERRLHLVRT